MEVNFVELAAVAVKGEQFPTEYRPEFVFVGRSNVGKSSLINAMINRKSLARTSQNPGKTRTINFYNVENKMFFVDLPGYGYAKISKSESEKWGRMIENYLRKREQIKFIIMLLDIRHDPTNNDIMLYEWLRHYDYSIIIVGTKSDKIKRSQVQRRLADIRKALGAQSDVKLIAFSSESKEGRDKLWEILESEIPTEISD